MLPFGKTGAEGEGHPQQADRRSEVTDAVAPREEIVTGSRWLAVALVVLVFSPAAVRPAGAADPPGGLNLIPWPKSMHVGKDRLPLDRNSAIIAGSAELRPLARILADEVLLATGVRLEAAERPERAGDLVLKINPDLKAGKEILTVRNREIVRTTAGAHRLTVTDRAVVEGFDYRAVAEGTATLLQALGREGDHLTLPELTVRDWPHADFMGALVDVARQRVSLDHLRECVEVCRLYKVRYLQLHLTDDQGWTFPSTAYPALGTRNVAAHGGVPPQRYDLDELKALVRFADERGVTLVPEVEMPGHSGAARRALPEVFAGVDPGSGKVEDAGMMNIASAKVDRALSTLLGEVADVFRSSPYLHIGGDEVSGLAALAARPATVAFMKERGLRSGGELIDDFTLRVQEMVRRHGKKTLIWEGAAMEASSDLVVVAWDNNSRSAEKLVAKGFTTITCPWNLGVPWPEWNLYVCNGSFLKRTDPLLGAMLPVWERGGEVSLQLLRDGAPRRQERTWGPDNTFTAEGFEGRFRSTDRLLDRLLYGFVVRPDREVRVEALQERACPIATPLLLRLEQTVPGARVCYTRGGADPGPAFPAYDGTPLAIADSTQLRARLFDQDARPLGATWVMSYRFQPLSLRTEGFLKDAEGKDSPWFAETLTLTLASTMEGGAIRYTLDGSAPTTESARYDGPVRLTRSARVRARWFDATEVGRGEVLAADYFKLPAVRHAGLGKAVRIVAPVLPADEAAAAARRLTDGYLARANEWWAPEVLRCHDKDFEAIVDLGQPARLHRLGAHFLHSQESGVFPPTQLTFAVSDDGKDFRAVARVRYDIPINPGSRGLFDKLLAAEVQDVRARYVKVVARNVGVIPKWHPVAGQPSHMMVDEIAINPEDRP
jgi:hexosaminidase